MSINTTLERRSNFRFFRQDVIPKKEDIINILEKSIEVAPIKNDIWHFKIDIYGPSWFNEKDDLCIRTVCKEEINLRPWEEQVKLYDEYKKNPTKTRSGFERYNSQVLAPYLLVYRKSPYHFNLRPNELKKNFKYSKDVAAFGPAIHSYVVSILANDLNIDASFCKCICDPSKSTGPYNNILQDEQPYLTLGLGYADTTLNKTIDGNLKLRRQFMRPELDDVIKWHE